MALQQHTCPLCTYNTRSRGILYRHLLLHTGVKPYRCEHCGKCYALPETLLRHMTGHSKDPPYQCNRCSMALDHFSEYLRHQVYHMLKSIYRCSFCGEGFVWKRALKEHARLHCDGQHLFKMFFGRRHLIKRKESREVDDGPLDLKMRTPEASTKREIPPSSKYDDNGLSKSTHGRVLDFLHFPPVPPPLSSFLPEYSPLLDSYYKFYMYPHLNFLPYQNGTGIFPLTPTPNGQPTAINGQEPVSGAVHDTGFFACRVCGWQFSKVSHLTAHMYVHTGRKMHTCDVCNKTFTRKGSLKLHRLQHLNEKPYQCEICHKTFLQARYLRAHILVHRRQEASKAVDHAALSPTVSKSSEVTPMSTTFGPLSLPLPDVALDSAVKELEQFDPSESSSGLPHRCPVCQKGFSQPYKLRRHMVIHASPRVHQCNICQKVLPSVTELRGHKKSHGRARLHSCEYCKKDFSCSSTLRRHVRIHTGEKPYQCEVCFKRFSDLSNKNCHMRTHTGEKPYSCEVCNMKFSLKNALNCHMRNHLV